MDVFGSLFGLGYYPGGLANISDAQRQQQERVNGEAMRNAAYDPVYTAYLGRALSNAAQGLWLQSSKPMQTREEVLAEMGVREIFV